MLQRLVDIKTDATAAFEKESKRLLVRLDEDLITLALADKASGSWQAAEILKAEATERAAEDFIQQLKQSSTLINYKGLETQVLVATPQAMAAPVTLSGDLSLFFEIQFGARNPAPLIDAVNENILLAFAPQSWQSEIVAHFFPEAQMSSTLALMTRHALLNTPAEGTCLYLHVGKTYAELVLMQQGQLCISRYLPYASPADLLYHLLNTARQSEARPASLSVQLQGFITDEDDMYRLLQQYFEPVSFAGNITSIRHKAFWKVPPHFFTGLMLPV